MQAGTQYTIHIARQQNPDRSYRYQTYEYIAAPLDTLIQAFEYIQAYLDRSVLFRRSCFHGSCGTCGVVVNGKKVLACLVRMADLDERELRVDPLAVFPVIGDVAINPAKLYAQLPEERQYLRNSDKRAAVPDAGARATPATPDGAATLATPPQRLEDCIECGLCETACPITAPFLGPAALAAYQRELINRPERRAEILQRVGAPDGVGPCKTHYACSKVCPTGVYPSGKIAQLRKELAKSSPVEE